MSVQNTQDNVDVNEEVKQLVSDIIARQNLKKTCKVKYYPGSQEGDGYMTKTLAVDVTDDETSLDLFIKYPLDIDDKMPLIYMLYAREIYFYKTIYPTYVAFLEQKGIKDGFQDVPMCYGFNETKRSEIVALENLKKKGFTLSDKLTCMNDEHLKLIMRSFAKFHAISFALKDQRRDLHDEFCEHCPNVFTEIDFFPKIFSNTTKDFVEKLDPIEDEDILARCDNLHAKVYDHVKNIHDYLTDYAIIAKGDCRANNIMVLYKNNFKDHPIKVMQIDWQCLTRTSPIHDLHPFFYPSASTEAVDNYKYYLEIYYEELSKRIEELGSDPEVLYPRSVFEKEWVDYGIYGLGLSIILIKGMLSKAENIPSLQDVEKDDMENMLSSVTDNEEEYLRRTKHIIRHMIDIGVL